MEYYCPVTILLSLHFFLIKNIKKIFHAMHFTFETFLKRKDKFAQYPYYYFHY